MNNPLSANDQPTAIDRVLTDHFRSTVPAAWPPCPVPSESAVAKRTSLEPSWARWALGLAMALILTVGLLTMPRTSPARPDPAPNDLLRNATADGKTLTTKPNPGPR